jgi:hypothetical protein
MGNGAGIAAFIIGIIAFFYNPWAVTGVVAIIVGSIGMKRRPKGFATAGFVFGIINTILWTLRVLGWIPGLSWLPGLPFV